MWGRGENERVLLGAMGAKYMKTLEKGRMMGANRVHQGAFRERLKKQGFKPLTFFVHADDVDMVKRFVQDNCRKATKRVYYLHSEHPGSDEKQ